MTILFVNVWPTSLAQHGYKVPAPKLPDEDFEEAQ
jgi:hypothetical protein